MIRRRLGLAGLVALLAFLSLYPLGMLLYGSLHSTPPGVPGTFNLDGYRLLVSSAYLVILRDTFAISLVKTLLALTLATLLAWIVARTDTPARRTLEVLITLPFFVPPILTATAWGMLGNPQSGTINLAWKALTGATTPLVNVYSWGGVVWHMMQYSTPFLFLFIVEAFRSMDPALEESSRMSGASNLRTFRRVTLALMLPVMTSAFILSFIRGVESFESPIFFGTPAGIHVLTTQIYDLLNQQATPQYQVATALGFTAMLLMALLILVQWRMLRGRSFTTVSGKGFTPRVIELGPLRWLTFAICIAFFGISVALPVGQLLLSSFFKFFGFYTADMFTFDNYRNVWANREFWQALGNTMWLGVTGATATMLLGSVVAYITVRSRLRWRRVIEVLAWLPWMMPGIVLAIGFLWAFSLLPQSIPIYGTLWALFLAYMALSTPVAVRVMSGAFSQLSADLEECALIHGATAWQAFWRILIALAWPSFAVGWMLCFFGILRELSASILLYAVDTQVLSVLMLKMWSGGKAEEVSVIALFMLALVLVFRWVQLHVINKRIGTLST
jgi:iron(III) transport system permease protein